MSADDDEEWRWVLPITPGPWATASIVELRTLADRHGIDLPDPQVRRALMQHERAAGKPEGSLLERLRRKG